MAAYIKILGSPTIFYKNSRLEPPTTKQHALLYYLIIKGDWVNREVLADLFWELGEEKARSNLRVALTKLNKDDNFNWAGNLEVERSRVRLRLKNDVSDFREAINDKQWIKAQELYMGPLLKGVNLRKAEQFDQWLVTEREALHTQWREALTTQAKFWEAEERFDDASQLMQILLQHEDNNAYEEREDTLLQLLRCADKSGEYTQALRCYQTTKKRFEQDGLFLSAAVEELAKRLEQKQQQKILTAESIPKYTIPIQANAFIGRNTELKEIANLLGQESCRLLTLKGLGGIGKTRLAMQVTESQTETFSDGVHFISLAALQSANNLAATILGTLKISLIAGQTPEEGLKVNLRDKKIFLTLDNFEQILAGASLLGELLEQAANLKILVTSREPLNISWEVPFEIFGMNYPEKVTVDDFANYDAVRLFTRTAKVADRQFQLTAEHYPAVLEICRVVEGMPLGLELAASWAANFSCQEIAEFLKEDVSMLENTLKDAPERHRNLNKVFEHSWNLLNELEQSMLSKLAIFRGGFDKDAAKSITKAPFITLLQLKQKSLVRKAKEERFDMHEVVRQGAEKKLKENVNEYKQTCTAHSQYYLNLFSSNSETIKANEPEIIKVIEVNLDNIREAWEWAVDELDADTLEANLRLLNFFYINQGRFQDILNLYNYAEAQFRKHNTQHLFFPHLLNQKSWCLHKLGDVQQSITYTKESIESSKKLKDTWGTISSLLVLGIIERERRNNSQARIAWQEALKLAEEHNEAVEMLNISSSLAVLEEEEGNYQQAETHYRHTLKIAQKTGLTAKYLFYLNNLATFLLNTEQFNEAEILLQEGLKLAETTNQSAHLPYFLLKLAKIANFRDKDYDKAWQLAQQALTLAQEQQNTAYCAKIQHFLGDVALATEQFSQSYTCLKKGFQLAKELNNPATIHEILISLAQLYSLEDKTDQAISLLGLLLQQTSLVKTTEKSARDLLEKLKEQKISTQLATEQKEKIVSLEEFLEKCF